MEKGRADNPSMALVKRLADHFGVTVAYLVGEDINAEDADPQLQRMFRQAASLDTREREILDDNDAIAAQATALVASNAAQARQDGDRRKRSD